ncbi:YAP1-binding protein 1 [Trichomonascus vanleenenianus]|uniref:YAP1-binding protein 1 n=1 Tax=Trichomonascus vanleenenianus TaxID=2268995 RepID=UPI003ECB56A2
MSDQEDERPQQVTVEKIIEDIKGATGEAIRSEDWISYATVLEIQLEEARKLGYDDQDKVLLALLDVLNENEQIAKEIGWDIPALVVPFLDHQFKTDVPLQITPNIKPLWRIFNVLAEKGNPKEVYLKAIEGITGTKREVDILGDIEGNFQRECQFDVKFYAYFELMRSSLKNIKGVAYPSRFLVTSTTTLLSFLAMNLENLDLTGIEVVIRRLFTFARDYECEGDVGESELRMQRKLLQSYLTWLLDITMQNTLAQWSQRLFVELKTGAEEKGEAHRQSLYELDNHVRYFNECADRIVQLMYSFDLDLRKLFREFVDKAVAELEAKKTDEETPDEGPDTETEESAKEEKPFEGLSQDGYILAFTQSRFMDRRFPAEKDLSLKELVALSIKLMSRGDSAPPYGIQDAVLFWALRVVKNVTKEEVREIPQKQFNEFLQQLLVVPVSILQIRSIETTREITIIVYSIVAKMLALHKEETAFAFIVDTLEFCPFDNVRDSMVRILKDLTFARKPTLHSLTQQLGSLSLEANKPSNAILPLNDERREKLRELALQTCEDAESDGDVFPLLLTWINFVTLVESDKEFKKTFADKLEALRTSFESNASPEAEETGDSSRRSSLLTLAIESLQKQSA